MQFLFLSNYLDEFFITFKKKFFFVYMRFKQIYLIQIHALIQVIFLFRSNFKFQSK